MVGGDEATTIALQLQRHRISKRVAYAKHADKVSRLSGTAAREAGAPRRLTAEAQLEFDLSAEALLAALGFDFCSPRCAAACPRAIKLAGQNVLSALRREECRTAEHLRRLIPAVQDGHVTGNVLLPSAHGSQHFPNGVCPNAYRAILAIKRSRWKRLRKKAVEAAAAGATEMIGRSLWTDLFAQPRVPVKHAIIWAWVEDWLRWHGDHNPMAEYLSALRAIGRDHDQQFGPAQQVESSSLAEDICTVIAGQSFREATPRAGADDVFPRGLRPRMCLCREGTRRTLLRRQERCRDGRGAVLIALHVFEGLLFQS